MIKKTWNFGNMLLEKYVGLRFFIAGGFAGVTDLVFLYILHNMIGIYYLLSAVLAFLGAFGVSFFLHKFWTFKSHGEQTHRQVVMYLGASLCGLCLNTLLMYIFVDYFHVHVILSQVIVGLMVACLSFFVSRNLVFKYKKEGL